MQRENFEIAVLLSEIVLFLQRENCEITLVLSKIELFSQHEIAKRQSFAPKCFFFLILKILAAKGGREGWF